MARSGRVFAVLCYLSILVSCSAFDWATGNTSVWLSAAAYCETNTYLTRTYKGYSTGFVPTYKIEHKPTDTEGFIGYMPSQQQIYVVFRGSTSIQDWVNNINEWLTDYPRCKDCRVHKGWYEAQVQFKDSVVSAVKALKAQLPSYTVVVSGHSLGAAMATLTTLDFLDAGISPLRMFHFGSPRVGNDEFAAYASTKIVDRNRNTHYKDMVPHCPMHERFTHISGEWYEDSSGLHQCSGYEDNNCSYQWHITSIDDHMHYLGLYMGCDAVSKDI